MAKSALYDLGKPYKLTFTPKTGSTAPTTDPVTRQARFPKGDGEPVTFEVHLEERSQYGEAARPGADRGQMHLEGAVVKTPKGTSLALPDGAAAHKYAVMFKGRRGSLEILPTPDSGIPDVDKEIGEEFSALFVVNEGG